MTRLTTRQRRRIESKIEELIARLDADDGDCDLEPEEDYCGAEDSSEIERRRRERFGDPVPPVFEPREGWFVPVYGAIEP